MYYVIVYIMIKVPHVFLQRGHHHHVRCQCLTDAMQADSRANIRIDEYVAMIISAYNQH